MNKKLFSFYTLFFFSINIYSQISSEPIMGLKSEFGKDVITKILIEKNESIGLITYLKRNNKRIKSQFFSYNPNSNQSAYEKFEVWSREKDIILLTSAGFSKSLDFPICNGLCIDDGIIISAAFDGYMDGLFFITPYITKDGDIITVNLEEDYGKIEIDEKNFYPRLTPFSFISACSDIEATVFQSQLFYFNNKPFYTWPLEEKSAPRRFFIAGYKDKMRFDIIVNIPYNAPLTSYVYKIFSFLRNEGFYIHSFFNLDTGWYNFFRLYNTKGQRYYTELTDKNGNKLSMKGDMDENITRASNFIVFYYE